MPYIIPVLLCITNQHILYYLIITIIYYSSPKFVLFCSYFLSHIFNFWWLMLMPYTNPVLFFITNQHILCVFFSHFYFSWMMLISYIIQVLLFITHQLIFLFYFFSSTYSPPLTLDGWCYVHFHPTFYLVSLLFSLPSIQLFHPTHGFFGFILCYLLSRAYTFSIMFIPHCKYFCISSCTRKLVHNAVNTRSQSLLHRTCTCTRPVRQMPFGVTTLKTLCEFILFTPIFKLLRRAEFIKLHKLVK